MVTSNLSAPHLHDDAAALAYLEATLWPGGPTCPHCGATDRIYTLKGKSTRPGVRKCGHCRKPFTVTVGTIFERSHVPLRKWLQAICLMTSSKKGISARQLHRILRVKYQTAWFMGHRIREAMRDGSLEPIGGFGHAVEADETFIGRKEGVEKPKGGYSHKHAVLSLVERGGKVRSVHIDDLTKETIAGTVRENLDRESWLMTDDAKHYHEVGAEMAGHSTVNHSAGEYVDPENATIHTNTIEGYFGLFKRGMKGIYQHCAEKHLHRYLAEFDFRYNNRIALGVDDQERAERALLGVVGKRLTYRQPNRTLAV
jgi:transposase-like protein